MTGRGTVFVIALFVFFAPVLIEAATPVVTLTVTPTIENAGVEISLPGDTNENATATVQYRERGADQWQSGQPLNYNTAHVLAGSLFFLKPATRYYVRVTVNDPDSGRLTLTKTFLTRRDTPVAPRGRVLYVAPDGNDANPGTRGQPFLTIQRAVDIVKPGDRVRVMPGVYQESVMVTRSGTAARPIVIESIGSAAKNESHATVEGSLTRLATVDQADDWLPDPNGASGVYVATLTEFSSVDAVLAVYAGEQKIYSYSDSLNPERVTYENFLQGVYCRSDTAECHQTGVVGGYWYDRSQKQLFLRLPDESDPDTASIHVIARNRHGFRLEGVGHVTLRGFETRYFHVGASIRGGTSGASDNVIEQVVARYNQYGLGVGGYLANGLTVHRNLVQDNTVTDDLNVAAWPWADVKNNDVESTGISVGGGSANVIRRNTISRVFNGIDMTLWWDLDNPAYNVNTDVLKNEVIDVGDDSIEIDGPGNNVRIIGNTTRRSRQAESGEQSLSLSPLTIGPTWVLRNTFLDSRQSNFKFFWGTTLPIGRVFVYHNTVMSSAPDLFALVRIIGVGAITGMRATFRNNAFVASGSEGGGYGDGYLVEDVFADHRQPSIKLDLDYNLYYSARRCENRACPTFRWQNARADGFSRFRTVSGLERHGLYRQPKFTAPSKWNFLPAQGSPLIDRGVRLPGINGGFQGRAPDVGGFERI